MIYTSYFENLKKIPKHLTPISISTIRPDWFEGEEDIELIPDPELLKSFKDGKINEFQFEADYRRQLDKLDPVAVAKKHEGHVLCANEKTGEFCHRHILADWLRESNIKIEEKSKVYVGIIGIMDFTDYDYIKHKLGQLKIKFSGNKLVIVTGNTVGTDKLSERWADDNEIEKIVYTADWDNNGKSAWEKRNKSIINRSDFVISIWDGEHEGIKKSIDYTLGLDKDIEIYKYKPNTIRVRTEKRLSMKTIDPNSIYVFKDNETREGKPAEVAFRNLPNTYGVATKKLNDDTDESFFSDQDVEIEVVKKDLREIYKIGTTGKTIVFPEDGLSDDKNKLFLKSPKVYEEINKIIGIFFGIEDVTNDYIEKFKEENKTLNKPKPIF